MYMKLQHRVHGMESNSFQLNAQHPVLSFGLVDQILIQSMEFVSDVANPNVNQLQHICITVRVS